MINIEKRFRFLLAGGGWRRSMTWVFFICQITIFEVNENSRSRPIKIKLNEVRIDELAIDDPVDGRLRCFFSFSIKLKSLSSLISLRAQIDIISLHPL